MLTETVIKAQTGSETFAKAFAQALRGRRRTVGLTLEQMAQRVEVEAGCPVVPSLLTALEAGTLTEQDPKLLAAVAASYDVDLTDLGRERTPIEIDGAAFVVGDVRCEWASEDIDDVLSAFLQIIRQLRRDTEAEVSRFRRVDIDVVAAHLDEDPELVVRGLAELLGTTDARPSAIASIYLAGADVIPTGADQHSAAQSSRLARLLSAAK
jgi:transcriptional regulator with XRE-family HTH domain